MTDKNSLFSIDDVIYSYTRKEAIADGLQILIDRDLSGQCGINFPVYFTQGVWNRYVEFVPENSGQDETGRLIDILNMFHYWVKKEKPGSNFMKFTFLCQFHKSQLWSPNERKTDFSSIHREVTLNSVVGPVDIDDPRPSITIMLPGED